MMFAALGTRAALRTSRPPPDSASLAPMAEEIYARGGAQGEGMESSSVPQDALPTTK